jgi:hypothetical protein
MVIALDLIDLYYVYKFNDQDFLSFFIFLSYFQIEVFFIELFFQL